VQIWEQINSSKVFISFQPSNSSSLVQFKPQESHSHPQPGHFIATTMSRSTSSSRHRGQPRSRSLIPVAPAYALDYPLDKGNDSDDPPPSYRTFHSGTDRQRAKATRLDDINDYQGVIFDGLLGAVLGAICGYFLSKRTLEGHSRRAVVMQGAVAGGLFGAAVGATHQKRRRSERHRDKKSRKSRNRYEEGDRQDHEAPRQGLGVVWEHDNEWD